MLKKKAASPLHLFGKVASCAESELNQDIDRAKGLKDHEKTALPKILYLSLSRYLIVLWKTVVERTIHRDQSAGLDINTDSESREFLAVGGGQGGGNPEE